MSVGGRPVGGRGGRGGRGGIEVEGLAKSFKGKAVLNDVHLVVEPGRIAVIEGANGAGKTTLIRILSTIVSADAGAARVNGFDVAAQSREVRRSIGVAFVNDRSLYWRVGGTENLELFGRLLGLSARAIAARSSALIEQLALGDVVAERVSRMSTGQRQRLMLARALLAEPAVLFLDEPLRGLDQVGLTATLGLLRTRALGGTTILVAAPLVQELLEVGHRSYRIEGGTLCPGARPGSGPGGASTPA